MKFIRFLSEQVKCRGKAMLKNRTSISYVAIPKLDQRQSQVSSDGLLSSSTTTFVDTFVSPRWFFGTSVENGGAQAFQTAYKVPNCNIASDPRHCIVNGGVNWVSMEGGNMKQRDFLADSQQNTVTGWSFLAQIIFTAVVAYFTAGALTGFAAPAVGGAASTGVVAGGATATVAGTTAALSAGNIAAIAAATYAGVNVAIQGTSCLTCTQGSWFGAIISNGKGTPSAGGFGDPTVAINNRFVAPGVSGNLQGGQADMLLQQKPKTWSDSHDPAYLLANPPLRSGVMQNYGANPIP